MSSTKWQACKHRLIQAVLVWLGIIAAGMGYALFWSRTGIGIPCVFRLITGLKCPGCGVSHMALCLLHGDIKGAWRANPVVLCLLPILLFLLLRVSVRYVMGQGKQLTPSENRLVIFLVVLLVGFGILRNIAP